jgi:hypothetical protein
MSRRPPDNSSLLCFAYRLRAGGKAGLMNPIRSLPLSATVAGLARTGGKAGVMNPSPTFPSSFITRGGIFMALISLTIFSNI